MYVLDTKLGCNTDDHYVAVVAGNWVYIDGGEFSFMSNGEPQFQYGAPFEANIESLD